MATTESTQPDAIPRDATRMRSPRLPILLGVFLGMVAWIVVTPIVERPLSELIFGVPPGKQAWATPGYYCIHRTILLALAAVGGTIGVFVSPMRRRYSVGLLFALLVVIAIFAAMFPR